MNVRKLIYSDYDDILAKWWSDWRWVAPLRDFLPENGTGGIIVYDNYIPVCAGFMYLTNSNAAWCEFVISNFEYKDKVKRKESLTLLLNSMENILKESGVTYLYTSLKNKSLMNIYTELGYLQGAISSVEMIKRI